eukprot:s1138_g11.t1
MSLWGCPSCFNNPVVDSFQGRVNDLECLGPPDSLLTDSLALVPQFFHRHPACVRPSIPTCGGDVGTNRIQLPSCGEIQHEKQDMTCDRTAEDHWILKQPETL